MTNDGTFHNTARMFLSPQPTLAKSRHSFSPSVPWDNRAHVTLSKNNDFYHTQFKQFFDKKCGDQQFQSPLRYMYKTPSNGYAQFKQYHNATKYYWDKRSPISPRSPRRIFNDFLEEGFNPDFHVKYSKNNYDRHPYEREYFDRPVNMLQKGGISSPRSKLPIDVYHMGTSHFNLK